jgi:hypothetical protein
MKKNLLTLYKTRYIILVVTERQYELYDGLWRSLVARLHGAQEVVSSNLASPTNNETLPHGRVSFIVMARMKPW